MKTNLLAPVAFACVLTALAIATPLTETTAVHTKPDPASPTISYLKAGTEPFAATSLSAATPAGWMAVELQGPFQGYVDKKDMTKGLDVKPGTPIRLTPQANGPILATAERGDKTTITGLQGRWAQISLQKNIAGYINTDVGAPGVPMTSSPAISAIPSTPVPPEAVAVAAVPSTAPGQPAVSSNPADSASLPRQLTGKFVSTRSVLRPRRPYDWALEDNGGQRFAYVDISKLLLTEQIDKYIGHFVVVFGAAKPTPDGKNIVIQVESLQLLMR